MSNSRAIEFRGTFPAITTPFSADLSVDHGFLAEHAQWQISAGCAGLIPCGSLGEAATLSFAEKVAVTATCVKAIRGPVIPGVTALSTHEAVELARAFEGAGASGLMVLPPYVYSTDWREMKVHVAAVLNATKLPCILYNNPPAYKTDFLPVHIAELASEHANLAAVKESSADVRRITALKVLMGNRLALGAGMDDALVEGFAAGAQFWVAGLVNAFPVETVKLVSLCQQGKWDAASRLYAWFLPLLRLDTVPKFVQLIKLVQERVGHGNTRVRGPRLALQGDELAAANTVIDKALANLPKL